MAKIAVICQNLENQKLSLPEAHQKKTPMLKCPLNKTASPQARSFIKKRLQHLRPPPPPPTHPP